MKTREKYLVAALALLSVPLVLSAVLAGQSANYRSYPEVIDNGGGRSASPSYRTTASAGQPISGTAESPSYTSSSGYLEAAYAPASPETYKNMSISRLEKFKLSVPPKEWKQIDQAIEKVSESLTPLWWVDPWHLNQEVEDPPLSGGREQAEVPQVGLVVPEAEKSDGPALGQGPSEMRYGEKVFEKEAEAAWKIRELTRKPYPPGAIEELIASAFDIMDADSVIAKVKIVEAELSGGDPKKLEKAYREMEKAEEEKQKPDPIYDRVVQHYGQAWLQAVNAEETGPTLAGPQILGIHDRKPVFALGRPYPNPSRSGTTVRYGVANECLVSLRIYDIAGRLVRTLVSEKKPAGYYACEWDGKDGNSAGVSSGTYIYRLLAGPFRAQRKVVLLR